MTLKLLKCCLTQIMALTLRCKIQEIQYSIYVLLISRRLLSCFSRLLLAVSLTFIRFSYSKSITLDLQQLVVRSRPMCHRFLRHSGGDALPQRQGQRARDSQLSHLKSESRFRRDPAFLPTVSTSVQLRIKRYYALL